MATVKVKLRLSGADDRRSSIYYQIIHERKVRQISAGFAIYPEEWNVKHSAVVIRSSGDRRLMLLTVRDGIRRDVDRLHRVIRKLDEDGMGYSVDDVVNEFRSYISALSLSGFINSIITRLRRNGKIRTSETYKSALGSFLKFRNSEDVMLDCVSAAMMEDYEAWLRCRGVSSNTVSFYARILRAAYNRAVEDGIIDDRNPFRRVYTGVDKTVKRALNLSVVRKIRSLDLAESPAEDFARDIFMLSFYMRGMSFVDMAFLRKKDLCNGYVTYRRRKTGQLISVLWTDEMQQILDKYPANESKFLLPIIRKSGDNELNSYRNRAYFINRHLKEVGRRAGVGIPLTMYVARHSWASVARAEGIPVSVISEGMGHDSEVTTQIYLASLDTSAVDLANSQILQALK